MLLEAVEQLFPDHNFAWERHGTYARGFCPLHHNTRTPSFGIYTDAKGREKWHCFTDNIGGNLVDLVLKSGVPGTETLAGANHWLMKKGYLQETEAQRADRARNDAMYKFYKWTNGLLISDKRASGIRAYLTTRHIDIETLPIAAVGFYPSVQEVKRWLIDSDLDEIIGADVLVAEGKSLNVDGSIIFFYRTSYSEFSRLKVRNVCVENGKDKKTFFLGHKLGKSDKLGYFSWLMDSNPPSNAILAEGEFDVGALTSLMFRENPEARDAIYCFGGGGNISTGIEVMQDMGVENIYIFPDNDEPGINYAADIAETFPDTYTLFPEEYTDGMDPAEWAATHTVKDLQVAFSNRRPAFMWIGQKLAEKYINATVEEQAAIKTKIIEYGKKLSATNRESFIKAFGTLAGCSLDSIVQEIEESSLNVYRKSLKPESFGVWMNISKSKVPEWKCISNVILEHVKDVILDDFSGDDEIERNVIIRATTLRQSKLITLSAVEFSDDKKLRIALVKQLGAASVLIEPRYEAQLRNSMVVLDSIGPTQGQIHEDLVYMHTGWRDGKYYTPKGYVDGTGFHELEDIKVELPPNPPYLRNYYLEDAPADMQPIIDVIRNDLLQVFPYEITLPYLAHVFWTVIAPFIPMAKPYALWVVGQTGSFKTSFTGAMASFFGNFKTADFETWRSTVNAIEQNGYYVKDMPFILDDYKGVDIKREEVTRCIQNYADRHGRSRMSKVGSETKLQKTYFIRGNLIVTAEDVPPEGETSVTARTLELRVPSNGSAEHLTNAQIGSVMFPGVMTKFIQFLCNKKINEAEYERILSERRQRFSALHARVRENLAANSIAWDFVAEFFGFEDLTPLYNRGLTNILTTMNTTTKAQQAGEVFKESLQTLIATGNYYLEGISGCLSTPHVETAKRLGWVDDQGAYIIGQEALAEVNKLRLQSTGSAMNYTLRTIYNQLIAEGSIIPTNGSPTKNKRIEGFQYKVVTFKKGVLEAFDDEKARDSVEPKTAVLRDVRSNTTDN